MAGDQYDSLARRLGIPVNRIPDWRQMASAPAAPAAAPSYEGAKLQDFMPAQAQTPIGPPSPPKSYEGATLQGTGPAGFALAEPPKGAPPARSFARATGDNVQAVPAAVSPKAMAQINHVADNSDAAKQGVKQAVAENDRKANLEGATFHDPTEGGQPASGYAGAGAPVLIDKGGRRPASWQVQEGMDLGPDARAANTRASERGYEANDLDFEAGKKAAEFERGYLKQHQEAAERFAVDETARAQKYTAQVDDSMGKLDALRAQIREAKVDPFGGVDPTVARIGQAVAIGLGAFASKHGENAGLEGVKFRISENIREQEGKLAKLERGARGEMNFLGQLKQSYGDIGLAKQAAHIAYLEKAKAELAKNLGDPSVADPRLLAAYERLNGKLDDELVQRTAQFKGLTEDRVIRHDVNAQPRYAGVGVTPEAKHDARYLSEAYEKAGLPSAISQLKDVDRVIDALGDGDLEGVGPIAGLVPNALVSNRAVASRQAIQSIKNQIGHSIFGGALSPTEGEKLNGQLDGAKDASSLRRTVQAYRQALQHRASNIAAGAGPEGVSLYEGRGGSVQRGTPSQRQISLDKPTTPTIKEAK